LIQDTIGGVPEALHDRVTLSPSVTVLSCIGGIVEGTVVVVACNRYLQLLGDGKLCLETVHYDEAKVEWILAR